MPRRLARDQVEHVCRQLLAERRRVTVRMVMTVLRERYGVAGRTERVSRILRAVESATGATLPRPLESSEVADLRERLRLAEERAARSEELERQHQDFWANRYAEKVSELERRYAEEALNSKTTIRAEQYLRIYQRAAELAQRLSRYEAVEPLISPPSPQSSP